MTREGFAPMRIAAVQKSSSRSARSFERTARASPVPVDEPEDDGDPEEHSDRAPGHRQRGRERHPQGQLREGADDLDEALHRAVDPSPVVAGEPSEHEADHEAHRDPDQPDRERDPCPVDDPGEQVAAQAVGAEEEEGPVARRAHQVEIPLEEPPELVGVAPAEESQALHPARVFVVLPLEGVQVELVDERMDEGSDELSLVKEAKLLRRRVDESRVARVEVVGREHLAHRDGEVQDPEQQRRPQREAVPAESPPHHPPLRGDVVALLLRGERLDRVGVEGRVGDEVRESAGTGRRRTHRCTPPSSRIRGSRAASAISDRNMPTTVSTERNMRKEPAR